MNTKEELRTLKSFFKNNKLRPDLKISVLVKSSILIVEDAYYQIILEESNQYDRLGQIPIWGITSEIRDRVHTYTSASVANYIMGNHLAGEILSRTATESSLGLKYLLLQEGSNGFESYIQNYIKKENERIRKWKNSAFALDNKAKKEHVANAEYRQMFVDCINRPELWKNFGIDIDSENKIEKWPNIYELFEKTGSEIDYRTVYGMMCSQVHSDAGDIINRILARLVDITRSDRHVGKMNEKEEKTFSHFMIHFGIKYYLEGFIEYANRFELSNAKKKINQMLEKEIKNLELIVEELADIRSS